ncbi:MAG: efflux RND transporter permease subunit [Myxococcota bacterium]
MKPSVTPEQKSTGAIAWMARNPVTANILLFILLVGGLINLLRTRQEIFPEFQLDFVSVTVPYPGASPDTIESSILLALEEAIDGLEGVKDVYLSARQGMGSAMVELSLSANADKVLADISNAVDGITSFPQDAERPIVTMPSAQSEVLSLVLHGNVPELVLRKWVDQARDELLQNPAVTRVEVLGIRPKEVAIEVPSRYLLAYNLTLQTIADRIRTAWAEIPAGDLQTRSQDYSLRTDDPLPLANFSDIGIAHNSSGSLVRLGDVATIQDGFADTGESAMYNGEPAMMIRVFRRGQQTPITVANAVKEYAQQLRERLPNGLGVTIWNDFSQLYSGRVNLVLRNAWIGLLLVFGVLGLFLQPRLAFWVTIGIPASFLGSFLLMPAFDASINMISLFAFIVTLGMVVDDAVIVGENIYTNQNRFASRTDAAIWGAQQMAVPISFAILTTITAFMPMFFIPGVMGKFFIIIPTAVVTVLIISLLESLFVLPAHLAEEPARFWNSAALLWVNKQQQRFSQAFEYFVRNRYGPVVRKAVNLRFVTIAVALSAVVLIFGLIAGGRIEFTFMPNIDSDIVVAAASLPVGTPKRETEKLQQHMIDAAQQLLADNGGLQTAQGVFAQIGRSVVDGGVQVGGRPVTGSHAVDVMVWLRPTDERPFTSQQFSSMWRKKIESYPNLYSLTFRDTSGPGGSSSLSLKLRHGHQQRLLEAVQALRDQLQTYAGLTNVRDDLSEGKQQLDVSLTDAGRRMGMSSVLLGKQVRDAFFGAQAIRRQQGRDEVKVMVRLPEKERRSLHDVSSLWVQSPLGVQAPLWHAARINTSIANTVVRREQGQRVATVKADLLVGITNSDKVMAHLRQHVFPQLQNRYAGLSIGLAGEQRDQKESMESLFIGFLLAQLVIYALLAIPFKSYTQPLLVMSAVPFGIVGAVIGHLIMGYNLSVISVMGIVALTGVVVNDSLVFIHAANHARAQGVGASRAVVRAGTQRFRPILLTSLTTFFGLMPMILETSMQARFLIPMAISLGFGVLFATLITLLLLPALYVVLDDLLDWIQGIGQQAVTTADQSAAPQQNA